MSTIENNGCKWCERQGLPILPLRLAYVPQGDTTLPSGLAGKGNLVTPLQTGPYMLRAITTGYVYTYQKVGGEDYWRCFAATDEGLFRELALSRAPTEKPTFTCKRAGHDIDASMISIQHANEVEEAWVGYSPVWLTNKARKHLQNTPALWGAVMSRIQPSTLVQGGAVPADLGFRATDKATLATAVAEYGDVGRATQLYANTTQSQALDRSGTTQKLVQRAIQKSPQGLVVLALNDVVGQMADVAAWRNLCVKDQAEYQSEEAVTRGFATRQIILSIRESIQNSSEPGLWDERYRDKLDIARLEADDKTYQQKTTALQDEVEKASADWLTFAQHPMLASIWQLYDGEDNRVGQQLEADIAACYEGMGATEPEKAWLETWLLASIDNKNHPLWRALTAGNKDVWEFLQDEAEGVLGVFEQGIGAAGKMKEWLNEHVKKANAKTPVVTPQEFTGSLSLSVMSLLPRLMKKHPQEAKLLGARLHMVRMVRENIVLYPHRFEASAFELIKLSYEMVWGDPKTGVPEYVRRGQVSLLKQQTVRGGFLPNGSRFDDLRLSLDVFLTEETFKVVQGEATHLSETAQRNLPVGTQATALVLSAKGFGAVNPYKVSLADVRAASKEMVGLGSALALWSFVSALDALDRADTAGKYTEAAISLTSSITAATSLVGEAMATTLRQKAVDKIKIKAFTRVGWIFSAVTGVVDAVQYLSKAWKKDKEGDLDARNNYYTAAFFAAGSGIAGALGIVSAATGGMSIGAFGFAVTLGPIAWGLLAIGATIASIYFLYQALVSEDTPLEIWMLKSEYRSLKSKREAYPNAKIELEAFHTAIYGLHVDYTWRNEPGRDRVILRVMMPGFDKNSEYAYSLTAIAKKGEDLLIGQKGSHLSNNPSLKPRSRGEMEFRAAPERTLVQKLGDQIESATRGTNFQKGLRYVREMDQPIRFISDIPEDFIKFTRTNSGAVLETTFLIDEDVFDHSTLQFEYWPDPINQPEIKMSLKASEEAIKKEGFWSYVF